MLLKKISVCLSLILLASCKNEIPQKEKTTTSKATAAAPKAFDALKHPNKALILAKELSLYNGLTVSDKKSGLYGLVVDVDSISSKRIALTKGDRCMEHNFVHINSPKIKGWAYGQYIFEYLHEVPEIILKLQDSEFKLYITKNFAIGASDDDGLTFCGDNNPIVLYNSKTKMEAFVPLASHPDYNSPYMVLDDFDGWVDTLKDASLNGNILTVIIYREFQEGSADITIEIEMLNEGYKGKVVSFVRHDAE